MKILDVAIQRRKHIPIPPLTEKQIKRFWSRVGVRGLDECWPWTGGIFPSGYGRISFFKDGFRAHRIAFFLHHGHDPGDLLACHTCDNKPCCNGAHLFRGSSADNHDDMKAKGRAPIGMKNGKHTHPESRAKQGGERNGMAKLTAAQVSDIRRCRGIKQPALAREYNVSVATISRIVRNKIWVQPVAGPL